MRIVTYYSYLNGWEFLRVHQRALWREIEQAIICVDAAACRIDTMGHLIYSSTAMNSAMRAAFQGLGWGEHRTYHWATSDARLARRTMAMAPAQQKAEIEAAGLTPVYAYNQTDIEKEKIAIEVRFGNACFVPNDLLVTRMSFYVRGIIDVWVEILPMKEFQANISSGESFYEGELYNLMREGRGAPGVPSVLIGITV